MSQPVLLWRRPLRPPCAASAGTPRWGARKPPPASESPVRTGVLGKRLPRELAESLRKVLNRPRGPLLLSCSGTHHAPPPPPPRPSLVRSHTPAPPHRAQLFPGRLQSACAGGRAQRPVPQPASTPDSGSRYRWSRRALVPHSALTGPRAPCFKMQGWRPPSGGPRVPAALSTADVCSPLLHRPPGSRPHPRTPR